MRDFMNIVKALAEQNRLRILYLLKRQDLCVCQIIEVLQLAPSTVSKHLSILHQVRLIDSTKKGRWVYYSLAQDEMPDEAKTGSKWIFESIADEPRIASDREKLKQVLKVSPEILCKILATREAQAS